MRIILQASDLELDFGDGVQSFDVEYSVDVVFEKWTQAGKRFYSADIALSTLRVDFIGLHPSRIQIPKNEDGYSQLERQAIAHFYKNVERFERDAIASLDVFP